jgi:hypothetical protein
VTLFDTGPPSEPAEPLSADRRRTIANNRRLAGGIHPVTRLPLANNGESCGTCSNLNREQHNSRSYFKCGLVLSTSGPGTDIRLRWPACNLWSE